MYIKTTKEKAMLSRIKSTKFIETVTLEQVLFAYRYNQTQVSNLLGINRGTLRAMQENNEDPVIRVYRSEDNKEIIKVKLHKEMGGK